MRNSGPLAEAVLHEKRERLPVALFVKLLVPDLLFTMGEGAVVALMQLFFILRFHLLPGPLGIIFTISGLTGGIFSLTAPLFVKRWSKLRVVTSVQYLTAPLMVLIGPTPDRCSTGSRPPWAGTPRSFPHPRTTRIRSGSLLLASR